MFSFDSINHYKKRLEDEVSHIDIRGIAGDHVLTINATPLPIHSFYAELDVEEKLPHLPLDSGITKQERYERLSDRALLYRCLAIHGDPGSGKTTFLRYYAARSLKFTKSPLPFYIRLDELYDYFKKLTTKSTNKELTTDTLLLFLSTQSENRGWNLSYSQLEKLAKNTPCSWLFDGLDELPSYEDRVVMVEFVTKLSEIWKQSYFIITSRPLTLVEGSIPRGFEVVGIAPLRNEEIKKFLRNWTNLIMAEKSLEQRNSYLADLESSILGIEFERIRELARNPVMLTSMVVIHYNQKHLPESKADLLESMIKWLIRSRDRTQIYSHIAEKAFSKLALVMLQYPEGRKMRVGLNWAANNLENLFKNHEQALNFLLAEREGGVIVPRGKGDIEFWHPLFGEYLAAKEIANKSDYEETGWWSIIKENLDKPEWKEVIALVPACLLRLGTDRVDLFFERLQKICHNSDAVTKTRYVGLVGSILKDLHAYGYNISNVSEWTSILNEIRPLVEGNAEGLTLLERYNAALAFGQLGDPRITNSFDSWIKLHGGEFKIGAQARDSNFSNYDTDATEWEEPVITVTLKPFEIGKYPVTVLEFSKFVESGGYEDDGQRYWSEEGRRWRVVNKINNPDRWEKQLLFPNCPITGISWYEANAYCNWLSMNSNGLIYRLPSEYEWEYAAKHGSPNSRFPWGDILHMGDEAEANWWGARLGKITPVGMFAKSNTEDGIADMIANVEELCADEWSWGHSGRKEIMTGKQEKYPFKRIVRGGSVIRVSRLCRSTYRSSVLPTSRYPTVGFRCVRQSKQF